MTDNLGTPPIPLTPTQLDCRRVIDELTVAVGHVPSYETIRHEMGWRSKSQVARHVRIRTDKRWLRHARGRQYSLEVVFSAELHSRLRRPHYPRRGGTSCRRPGETHAMTSARAKPRPRRPTGRPPALPHPPGGRPPFASAHFVWPWIRGTHFLLTRRKSATSHHFARAGRRLYGRASGARVGTTNGVRT